MSRLLDLATGAALGALGLALIVTLNERLEEETRRLWRRGLLAASRAARSTLTYDQEDEHGDEQEFSMSKSPGTPGSRAASGARKCQLGVGYNKQLADERRQIYALLENLPRLPELDYVPTAKYEEAPIEEVLHPLIAEASVIIVAGAYFGDEGKGKTVDAIARHPEVKVVARVNSGENAGHTVFGETGHKYDFHLCPSGLLTPGKVNMIGPECVMDPVSFMEREVSQLVRTGVSYKERLFIGNVHLVCPHHKLLDLIGSLDHLFNGREGQQGSRARDLNRRRLERDMGEYWGALSSKSITEEELHEKAKANSKIQPHAQYVLDLFDRYVVHNADFPPCADVSFLLRQTLSSGGKALLEGSSRVGSGANPCALVPQHYFAATDSTKEDFEAMQIDWRDVCVQYFGSIGANGLLRPGAFTNHTGTYDLGVAMAAASCVHPSHREFGVTSGRPRVVGFFDCVAHAELMQAQGPYCSISAFDRADDYDTYAVCVAYVYVHPEGTPLSSNGRLFRSGDILRLFRNGDIIRAGEQLPTQQVLAHCQPVLKKVDGWRETPIFARSEWWLAQQHPVALPENVCKLLDIIEHFTKTVILSIGNGPRGDEIIYLRRLATRAWATPSKASRRPSASLEEALRSRA
ncbi:Adenylosuccinate synthase [Emiliania huxleyi CCMP1516]|uniref:Adenylosuccinate synthetase n=2 Tax=Emiliania huxleyi TaxID=2903 RepID=A0A0D3JV35_EMIH1|nr:Adenylosuccinate synthase [Emiliania huxleyi CCMP1516]EOD27370.1 Adenylosuccinate synthase [Emiliania huxleyi CCMP1516]|eukprot:XP_005779799.1 Adenylosuccinate synthase [Emiliania huxleyi CCMP1516]